MNKKVSKYIQEQIKSEEFFWDRLTIACRFIDDPRMNWAHKCCRDKFQDLEYILYALKSLSLGELWECYFFATNNAEENTEDGENDYARFCCNCTCKIQGKELLAKRNLGNASKNS